ncbi:MAG: phosphomannomutase/phosphoglucomutase [Candidatus Moranbacteria bacterium]|jgi:phosphomannomutase|nr:phosphomannomutase/phosphoglucomutase [Candidatus Moranbacteria bacterium]MDX9855509.1 phosphomannomutase/phosphoglucomutase [Candidatus Moranbacteria bacterium]
MQEKIFKAYDVRGIYPEEINEGIAYKIGRAFVKFLGAKNVVIGRDIRESSPSLFEELKRGITDEGADAYDLGLATTPMVYFASGKMDVDGGIMLTASHNPKEYNGMKFCRKNAVPVGENSGLLEIKDMVMSDNFEISEKNKGETFSKDIKNEYFEYFSGFLNIKDKKFELIIDTANAMGILELEIYKKFPQNLEIETLYDDFDSSFPNHEANPLKLETLEALQKEVISEKADLGIAYDGDADRVGFIDEKGEVIPMDLLTGLIAKIILEKNPGATILYDLRSSMAVREIIEENGGTANECRVGHALIKKQMLEDGAVFAGELSGHYYFKENFNAEAGSLPAIYILNLLAETGKPISELVKELRRYYHSGEINSEVNDKDAVLTKLKEKYKDGKLDELDGVKISYWNKEKGSRWWFNVRPSNTEPVLRLNLEADNKELMEEKLKEILGIIKG